MKKCVFGPIASRRLGVSLGIDLLPPKTCPLDCIYCEAGATTNLTLERREYVPVKQVLEELENVLSGNPDLDYITFSGSGEPTLHSGLGEIIAFLKQRYPQYRICLLTNAMLFEDKQLLREIASADLVMPSLDASCAEEFEKINRPCPSWCGFERFVSALTAFTRQSDAAIDLELFVSPGINDSEESIQRFAGIIRQMRLRSVQINTLDRPGVDKTLLPAPAATTARFAEVISKIVPVEVLGALRYHVPGPDSGPAVPGGEDLAVLAALRKNALDLSGLSAELHIPESLLRPRLHNMFHSGLLAVERRGRHDFFTQR